MRPVSSQDCKTEAVWSINLMNGCRYLADASCKPFTAEVRREHSLPVCSYRVMNNEHRHFSGHVILFAFFSWPEMVTDAKGRPLWALSVKEM